MRRLTDTEIASLMVAHCRAALDAGKPRPTAFWPDGCKHKRGHQTIKSARRCMEGGR